jgi:hypothetical protein
MNSVIVGAIILCSGAFGLLLQQELPERFTTGGPRDMMGAVVGLLTLLSALVLGLLIWTAYGVYSNQNDTVQNYAAKVLPGRPGPLVYHSRNSTYHTTNRGTCCNGHWRQLSFVNSGVRSLLSLEIFLSLRADGHDCIATASVKRPVDLAPRPRADFDGKL